jgi:DNA polymerase-3 subunit alpha
MNLAYKYPILFWNCACLISDSGSDEEDETEIVDIYEKEDTEDYTYTDLKDRTSKKKEKNADYAKIAKAIGDITSRGIDVSLVNINTSDYGFKPDIENNRILYGLKALSNINADIIEKIKAGRPYIGIKDFMRRCPLTKKPMLMLIKAGAFDEIETVLTNRKEIMAYYISQVSEPKKKLNLQNWSGLVSHNLVPKELELQVRVYNFNKYVKSMNKNTVVYLLNDECIQFLERFLPEVLDKVGHMCNGYYTIEDKWWEKNYQSQMDKAREWLKKNQEELLKKYNDLLFKELWDKYAANTQSAWEMEALCFYHGDHELKDIDMELYDLADFNNLVSNDVDYYFKRGGKQIPIYKLYRIAGTVLSKNDTRHMISLLTTTGVVTVKMSAEQYAKYKKQVSQVNPDGTKTVIEKSWFKRGTMLMFTGYRRDDQFVTKTYSNTPTHQIYIIDEVNGSQMKLRHERFLPQGGIEEDYEE